MTGIVKGYVYDNANGNTIGGATITVLGTSGSYTTGSNGAYMIQLPAGNYTLRTSANGYQTNDTSVTITAGGVVTKNIGLNKA